LTNEREEKMNPAFSRTAIKTQEIFLRKNAGYVWGKPPSGDDILMMIDSYFQAIKEIKDEKKEEKSKEKKGPSAENKEVWEDFGAGWSPEDC
jgi:hypothetical protein